jgi:MFS family permease
MRKVSYLKIFLLGMGFFGISVLWALYNADVPIILQTTYKLSNFLTGWVMNLDNILAVILIPIIGFVSDRTNTKIGRRMPYIITGMPIGGILFMLIPIIAGLSANGQNFWLLFVVILIMNIAMAVARAPVISLMPDVVPSEERSPANGIINFMGGFGSLLVYFLIGRISASNRVLGFFIAGLLVIISAIIVFVSIKEKRDSLYYEKKQEEAKPHVNVLKVIFRKENIFLLFVLLAIFFWFVGYNGIETFYTVFMAEESGMAAETAEKVAKLNLGIFSLTFMIFALPAGFIGKKFGRKRTILTGIVGLFALFLVFTIFKNLLISGILFGIGGFFWSLININSLPMVLDLGTEELEGSYTGLYYFFSQAANIVAPPLAGYLADTFNTKFVIFPLALVFFAFAFLAMSLTKGGEAKANATQNAHSGT